MRSARAVVAGLFVCLLSTEAAADERSSGEDEGVAASTTPTAHAAASVGAFLAFSQPASTVGERGVGVGLAGYDSARHASTFEATTEVRLWGPVSLRGGAVYAGESRSLRPSVSARVQILREDRRRVDLAFGVSYRPEGLTEPEGEIEGGLAVGRHVGGTYLIGNVLYGQDPEGNERDGEVRLAALRPFARRVFAGVDGRTRFDLGSQSAILAQHQEATFDSILGPTVLGVFGPVAVMLQSGGSVVRRQGRTSFGAVALCGIGVAF